MIQNYKNGETVQCVSEQKAYLRLPQEYGNQYLATLGIQIHQECLKKK